MSDLPSPTTKLPLEVAGGVYQVAYKIMNCVYLLLQGGETEFYGLPPRWNNQAMGALRAAIDAHKALVKKTGDYGLPLADVEDILGSVLIEATGRQVDAERCLYPQKVAEIRKIIARPSPWGDVYSLSAPEIAAEGFPEQAVIEFANQIRECSFYIFRSACKNLSGVPFAPNEPAGPIAWDLDWAADAFAVCAALRDKMTQYDGDIQKVEAAISRILKEHLKNSPEAERPILASRIEEIHYHIRPVAAL
jgi:hypothetical protein